MPAIELSAGLKTCGYAYVLVFLAIAPALAVGAHAQEKRREPITNTRGLLTDGEAVPTQLKGFAPDKSPITFEYRTQGRPTVVYVVNVFDGALHGKDSENAANFAAIVKATAARFSFVLLAPVDDDVAAYVKKAKPAWGTTPVTVVTGVSMELRQDMSLFAYPQTLVISTDSRVLRAFQGSYTNQSLNAKPQTIEAFFGVKLPGVTK